MKVWNRLRERRAAKRREREREAKEDLEAIARGEVSDLSSFKRAVRREYVGEGFPSAGGGFLPTRFGERLLSRGRKIH